eukprot:2819603-Rhodomonas_salina.2
MDLEKRMHSVFSAAPKLLMGITLDCNGDSAYTTLSLSAASRLPLGCHGRPFNMNDGQSGRPIHLPLRTPCPNQLVDKASRYSTLSRSRCLSHQLALSS